MSFSPKDSDQIVSLCMYVCICMYACIRVCMYVCMYVLYWCAPVALCLFSPSSLSFPLPPFQKAAWEKDRKTKENAVVRFLNTWKKVHRQEGEEEEEGGQRRTIRPLVAKVAAGG